MDNNECLDISSQKNIEARKNAIQNMIFFRSDQRLYIFWRNVYKCYRNAAWKEQGLFQTKGAEQ